MLVAGSPGIARLKLGGSERSKSISQADAASTLNTAPRKAREPFWPTAVVIFGVGLTVAWTILLG